MGVGGLGNTVLFPVDTPSNLRQERASSDMVTAVAGGEMVTL